MRIVTIHSKDLKCRLCGEPLISGEQAFQFYNRGKVKHVHLLCQYNKYQRDISFEDYLKNIVFQRFCRKVNLDMKKLDVKKIDNEREQVSKA
jgi:hypothetical protein